MSQDRDRAIPAAATQVVDGRRYMKMACGHCAQLTVTAAGQTLCAIYDERPEACRAFRAGSFECLKARQHRGPQAMAWQNASMAEASAFVTASVSPARATADLATLTAPALPIQMPPPVAALPEQSLPPG